MKLTNFFQLLIAIILLSSALAVNASDICNSEKSWHEIEINGDVYLTKGDLPEVLQLVISKSKTALDTDYIEKLIDDRLTELAKLLKCGDSSVSDLIASEIAKLEEIKNTI